MEALRALYEIAAEARECEGLQTWWGVDSENMLRFDAALDAARAFLARLPTEEEKPHVDS